MTTSSPPPPSTSPLNLSNVKLSKQQQDLNQLLKQEFPSLSELHRIMIVFSKKTPQKSRKTATKLLDLIQKYQLHSLSQNRDQIERFLKSGMLLPLPHSCCHTKQSYGVMVLNGSHFQPGSISEKVAMQCIFFLIEQMMLENEHNLTHGVTFVCDLKGFGWKNFDMKLEAVIQKVFGFFPMRFKKAWLTDAPWYIKAIMGMLRPFMSQKMADRYEVCSVDTMAKDFDPQYLPTAYGGQYNMDSDALIEHYIQAFRQRIAQEEESKRTDSSSEDKPEDSDKADDDEDMD